MSTNQSKLVSDVVALVRARSPIILIQTVEEKRVERAIVEPLMHASESDAGDLNNPELYHLAVRVTRVKE